MFFLRTQIQQDEHGRCVQLSPRNSSAYSVEFHTSSTGILPRAFLLNLQQALVTNTESYEKDPRGSRAGAWPMSGVYWGIVTGVLAMVATLFVCIDILYGAQGGSSKAPEDGLGESNQAVGSASPGSRQAA